jgi:radical SAM superfamily enzyme YgiQ (UPF0313 family)
VDEISEPLLELMRHADCEWLGFGVESLSPTILRNMRKGNSKQYPEQAERAVRLTREAGIWCNCTFIIGYPGETWESIRETARFMKEHDVLNNMFYATAYPSTKLYSNEYERIIETFGNEDAYIKSLGDATEFRVNFSELTNDQLKYARRCAINGRWELISEDSYDNNKIDNTATLDPLSNKILGELTKEGISYATI